LHSHWGNKRYRDFAPTILTFGGTLDIARDYPIGLAVRENVMKIVPVIKSSDLQRSLHFYTELLDFERTCPGHEDREIANGVVDLVRDGAELQLSRHSGDGVFGSVNRVFVDDVDERYVTFRPEYDAASRFSNSYRQLIRRGDCVSLR
jgi:Glyoxalase superfamily protein